MVTDRNITLTLTFLLGLAIAKRVSRLHGLCYEAEHSWNLCSWTFSFVPKFFAKTQNLSVLDFAIQGVYGIVTWGIMDSDEMLLCLVRTMN